ncbi:phage holin family protein [Planctomicrobium sp. SH661]|uniref:phage holin family protein n=1 Tax=Planctomicrobium sp. SH661 TaxID=3448124 RepID=UPI003F5C8B36
MRQHVTILAQDAMRLADLQMQLLALDIAEFWQRARYGLVFCIVGASVMLGALPLLLMALSEYIDTHTTLSTEMSQGLVAGVAILVGGIALWLSIRQLTKAGASLQRSQAELRANITWLRSVINREDD